jgi:hypothetical protein
MFVSWILHKGGTHAYGISNIRPCAKVIRSQKLSIGPEVVNLGSSLEILKGDNLMCNSSVFVIQLIIYCNMSLVEGY